MNTSLLSQTITHPQTAWWMQIVLQALALATLFALTLALRGRLFIAVQQFLIHKAARNRCGTVDPALIFTAQIASAQHMLLSSAVSLLIIFVIVDSLGSLFIALLLAGPATMLLLWAILWLAEIRYINSVDRALPPAVNRLAALIASGTGPQQALEIVARDMPASPLRSEWMFVIEGLGAQLVSGGRATAADLTGALALQTPSIRHRNFLGHLEMALTQTQDVLRKRLQAAGDALYAAEQRRSAAVTELAQVRYGGLAVGLAGLAMAVYLFFTQRERFTAAYRGTLGLGVGMLVTAALLAPIIAGYFLSRAEEIDY